MFYVGFCNFFTKNSLNKSLVVSQNSIIFAQN
jgi:hypothetical protein